MPKLSIYEPAAGCLTGACGPDPEEELALFEAALEDLRGGGVEVERFNLGHEPEAFAANAHVKATIKQVGMACLPMTLVDGEELSRGQLPTPALLRTRLAG